MPSRLLIGDNELSRSQYRSVRRDADGNTIVATAVVLHTAEGTLGWDLATLRNFICRREDPGSYHHAVDVSGNHGQYRDYGHEAFHASPRNNRQRANAIGIGLAFTFATHHWHSFSASRMHTVLTGGAEAFLEISAWSDVVHGEPIPPRHLTPDEYWAGVRGYIFHSELDPSRRSDPGSDFPADAFEARVHDLSGIVQDVASATATTEEPSMEAMTTTELQTKLVAAGYVVSVDGDAGPQTRRAVAALLSDAVMFHSVRRYMQRDAAQPI